MRFTENHFVDDGCRRIGRKVRQSAALLSVWILAVIFGPTLATNAWSQINHEETKTGGSANAITVATSTSLSGANGHLYLAAISTQPRKNVDSVYGLGLTWSLVKAKCSGRLTTGVEVWMAQGKASTVDGVVTVTFASAPKTAVIAASRFSGALGVSPIGDVTAGNPNGGPNGKCTGGVDSISYSFDLNTTANNALVYGAVAIKGRTHKFGAGYTELAETRRTSGASTSGVAVETKNVASPGNVTVNGSFGNVVDWAFVGLEIKPAPPTLKFTLTVETVGSGSVTWNPSGNIHDSGTVVTLTATPQADFQFSGWSDDLSGSTNPATITMDGNRNVTAIFTPIPGGGPIVHQESRTGGSSNSLTVATSANVTGISNHLYLAAISTRPKAFADTVTGLGLNWSLVKSKCSGRSTTGVEVWMAQGPSPTSSDPVTATFATAPKSAVITVSRFSGVDTVDPIGTTIAGNTNGSLGAGVCTGGTDSTAYSVDLKTKVSDAVVYAALAIKNSNHIPGAGLIERAETHQGSGLNISGVATVSKHVASASMVNLNGTMSDSTDWALAALEIKPQSSGPVFYTLTVDTTGSGSVALNPVGGSYAAGTVVTLTATPDPGFQFTGWSGALSGSTNPTTITMDGNKTVTATFTQNVPGGGPIVYHETQTGASDSVTTVSTAASLVGVNGHLYLAAISTRRPRQVVDVTGLGLPWTPVRAQCSGDGRTRIEVWMAQGPANSGIVTATFAIAPDNAVIAVSRYSGTHATDPIGQVISGNTNGLNAQLLCSGGVDTSFYAFPITTTTGGAVIYGAAAMRSQTHFPGVGYVKRATIQSGSGGSAASVAVQEKTVVAAGTDVVDGTFSNNVDYAVVGLEILPPLKLTVEIFGSGAVALDPPGGFYNPGTVVTLTATPGAGFQFDGWGGDLSGSTNPAAITIDTYKNVTATFTSTGSGNQVVHEETKTGKSTSSTTVRTSASLAGVNDHLYLAAIATKTHVNVTSVSGLGLNWSEVESQCSENATTGIEVWKAQGTPSGNGFVTAMLEAQPSNAVIVVSRYSGVDVTTPVGNTVSGNVFGANGPCTPGNETAAYSINLATTANGAVAYGAVTMRSREHTPGIGFTERGEDKSGSGGAAASAAVQDRTVASASTVAINGTFSDSVAWAAVGVEIRPSSSQAASKRGAQPAGTIPSVFALEQNYPNPFSARGNFGNPSTMIDFALPLAGKVTVNIFNETGQLVRTLLEGEKAAGNYSLRWNGRNQAGNTVASGVYLYQMVVSGQNGAPAFTQTRRMMYLK